MMPSQSGPMIEDGGVHRKPAMERSRTKNKPHLREGQRLIRSCNDDFMLKSERSSSLTDEARGYGVRGH